MSWVSGDATSAESRISPAVRGVRRHALGLSEPDAFARIQATARQRNLRLVDVARTIVEQRSLYE
jgi:response regulator NasT